jgi:hypothetical protein
VLLGISIILLAAKFGGDLMVRVRQPAVLGELLWACCSETSCSSVSMDWSFFGQRVWMALALDIPPTAAWPRRRSICWPASA